LECIGIVEEPGDFIDPDLGLAQQSDNPGLEQLTG
jgi:hypothetical protein